MNVLEPFEVECICPNLSYVTPSNSLSNLNSVCLQWRHLTLFLKTTLHVDVKKNISFVKFGNLFNTLEPFEVEFFNISNTLQFQLQRALKY